MKNRQKKTMYTDLSRNSMKVESLYRFPHFENLKPFVCSLLKQSDLYVDLIVLSIFSGLSVDELVKTLSRKHEFLSYSPLGNKISGLIPDQLYAQNRKNINVSFCLPEPLSLKVKTLFEHYSSNKEIEISYEIQKIQQTLSFLVKNHSKQLTLSIATLPKLLEYYYAQFNNTSDISILFAPKISQNDSAKVGYVQHSKRLIQRELWILEFYSLFSGDENFQIAILEEDSLQVGSPFFIEAHEFRLFLNNLDQLYLQIKKSNLKDKQLMCDNLSMIAIRYVSMVAIATRDAENSCSFFQYSRRFQTLVIQEKNKSHDASIRIIPLTKLMVNTIRYFHDIKNRYQFNGYIPVLLENQDGAFKTIQCNPSNIHDYIKKVTADHKLSHLLCSFISKHPLRSGRHIFSTLARRSNLKKEYEDAFLNHFYLGNVDMGVYSNFNSQEYCSNIKNFIEKDIEPLYIPSSIYCLGGLK